MGNAHKNCIGQQFSLHHITGTAFIIRLKLYAYYIILLWRTPRRFRKYIVLRILKGHCIEFKYYADGIHSGLTPPGNNS